MKNAIAPALEADARAVTLLEAARMQNGISDTCEELGQQVEGVLKCWQWLDKPASEIAELQTMINWSDTVRNHLLTMCDECDKEFAALDESVRDEAEQTLGS